MKLNSKLYFLALFLCCTLIVNGCAGTLTTNTQASSEASVAETQGKGIESAVPLPRAEADLPTVYAEPYLKISDDGLQLEGPAFDREGNLFIVEVYGGRIFKISQSDEIETVFDENDFAPAAIDIHKDGRLFVCGLGDFKEGSIFAIEPDGSGFEKIVSETLGYLPDDMIFDHKGGFYFTDFNGYSTNPTGGVYYMSPDGTTITPILKNLSIANGIALSPDGSTLWVTELGANRLHCVNLLDDGVTIAPFGASIAYYFTGNTGPDSMCVDSEGNLYVAMYPQGRILVLNKRGLPIGQILIPERDEGKYLRTTSMAFRPGTDELVITTNDWDGGGGSWLYTCKGFGEELPLYSHDE
jgi:lactonase